MNFVTPSSYGSALREANDCHNPAGSPEGGQFCSKGGGGASGGGGRSSRAATHLGECQLCGSQQALPSGKLAKHGYTVRWGLFSGTCPGSGHKPYNTHTDRIASAIEASEKAAASARAMAKAVRDTPATEATTSAWMKSTRYVGRGGDKVTSWEQKPIYEETYGEGRYKKFLTDEQTFTGQTRRREINFPHPIPKTRVEAIDRLNEQRAQAFEAEAGQRDAYISWLRVRQNTWKEKPLTPREAPRQTPRNEKGERLRTRTVTRDGKPVVQTLAYRANRFGRRQWILVDEKREE